MPRRLYPTFNDPDKWRSPKQRQSYNDEKRKQLRQQILKRDNNTCVYCGFQADKYMIAHHINDDPNDLRLENLETIYKESKFSQEDIIRITRQLRALGKNDEGIIQKLGLKRKVPFEQDLNYLKGLYGFITSRKAQDDMTIKGLREL